jgi:YHS domain-containing protein
MNHSTWAALTFFAAFFLLASCSTPLPPGNITAEGIAIKGYDPFAYFTAGEPIQGKKEFKHQWNGATWLFASKMHLEMFKSDPSRYAPQYGGY